MTSSTDVAEVEPHIRAVLELLRDRLPGGVGVSLAVAPATPPPYVVLYPDPGSVEQSRIAGDRSILWINFLCHSVAVGPEQAGWLTDRLRTALLGEPPLVPGRRVARLTQTVAQPVRRDNEIQPPLYLSVSGYRLMSQGSSA